MLKSFFAALRMTCVVGNDICPDSDSNPSNFDFSLISDDLFRLMCIAIAFDYKDSASVDVHC